MLNKTLSAITAIVIGTSGVSAESMDKSVSVSVNDQGLKKDVIVVDTSTTPEEVVAPMAQTIEPRRVVYQPIIEATDAQVMQPAISSRGYDDTIIYANGVKNYYEVGESIRIKLKLKRKAFIYFWTVGSSGNSYRILPNSLESYNSYKAYTNYVVPHRSASYDFKSDREGIEQIYVLASNKKINTAKLQSIFAQKSVSNKSMRKFMTKDIQVVARNQNLKYDIASFQIQVRDRNNGNVNIYINQ